MAELSDLLPDYSSGFAEPKVSAFDWISGFTKSGLESIPELIGITPSADTSTWRAKNPVAGFASEMAGMAVPYTGWLKVARSLPRFEAAVQTLGNANKSPFLTGAVQEAARFAPFELGRVAVSQVAGDKDLGDMLGSATMNLALGSGVGGLLHGMGAASTREPALKTLFPDIDVAAPLPLQARQMREAMAGMSPGETLDRAAAKLNETLKLARTEELPSTAKYISPLEAAHGDLDQQLNRLFRVKEEPDARVIQVRKFAQGANKDFPTQDLWKGEAAKAGLPEGFEETGQYFRTLSFKGEANKVAQTIEGKLTNQMTPVGDNLFMAREANDGMFVMAKKYEGSLGKASSADKWVIFKTDQPGLYAKDADKWSKIQIAQGKWTPGANLAQDGGEVYNTLKGFTEMFPLRNYQAIASNPKGIGKLVDKMIPQSVRGPQNELVARMGEAMKEYLSPRVYQFKNNFRANWIMNATKAAYDRAETLTNQLMNGKVTVDETKNLFFQNLKGGTAGPEGTLPIRQMAEQLKDADFRAFWEHVWRPGTPVADLPKLQAQGLISPEVSAFARNLDLIDRYNTGNINKAEAAVGRNLSTWKEGHYGLSRNWEGDTRYTLRNDAGELVAVAGGPNRRAARANADALVKENPGWRVEQEYAVSSDAIPKDVKPEIHTPSFVLERQNIRGFKWDTQAFTKDDFMQAMEDSLRARQRYQANLSTIDVLSPHMDRLRLEDSAAFRMIEARMNDYAGVQSTFSKWQNKTVDTVLGPMLGTNSATKIVQYTNTALFNLQLGALKLAYPVVNALQFIQTVIPEAAFVMGKGVEPHLAGKYSHFAAGGSNGPVGGVGVLSPLKLMATSVAEMKKPSKELTAAFEQAVNDRVIDPRLVEGYIGESATKVKDFNKVVKGDGNFVEWLRAVSEFMPAETERMSRTHAFTVGFGIARDFLRKGGNPLSADEQYNFARQFTENTMYLYSASDKPRIFTTPAGSALGLFKNWMFNYISTMGEYTGQAFTHNNWAPLLWQTSGTFALGGLAATPGAWVANQFSQMWTGKSSMQLAYDQFGQSADGIMLGLPAAITGISLYSQVNSPMANPTRDASSLFSIAAWDRVKYAGKTYGAAMDHWSATGEHPGYAQGVRELMARTFAPTTVYRSMAAMGGDNAIHSLGTGLPTVKNVSPIHRALYGLGFNPVELDRAQAVSNELYESQQSMKAAVIKYGKAWAGAEQNGDREAMARIMRNAVTQGVDISSVIASGMTNLEKQREDAVGRRIRPEDLGKYKSIMDLNLSR